jgi:hypothetical protein
VYRFLNKHLKNDDRPIDDSEVDLVGAPNNAPTHPIAPSKLRAFPTDADLPADQLNTTIDQHFVPLAQVSLPESGQYEAWRAPLMTKLKRLSLHSIPEIMALLAVVDRPLETRLQQRFSVRNPLPGVQADQPPKSIPILIVLNDDEISDPQVPPAWAEQLPDFKSSKVILFAPRGVGPTRWTTKNPPNYVERSLVLLGQTADLIRLSEVRLAVLNLASAAKTERDQNSGTIAAAKQVRLVGRGRAGLLAAYAANNLDPVMGVTIVDPPLSHMDSGAPQFLNILRVCDVPEMLGLLAPRPLTIIAKPDPRIERVGEIYRRAGAADKFEFKPTQP